MSDKSGISGGGAWIALGAIGGSIAGLYAGQPSIGLLAGVAAGSVIAVALWLRSRG